MVFYFVHNHHEQGEREPDYETGMPPLAFGLFVKCTSIIWSKSSCSSSPLSVCISFNRAVMKQPGKVYSYTEMTRLTGCNLGYFVNFEFRHDKSICHWLRSIGMYRPGQGNLNSISFCVRVFNSIAIEIEFATVRPFSDRVQFRESLAGLLGDNGSDSIQIQDRCKWWTGGDKMNFPINIAN